MVGQSCPTPLPMGLGAQDFGRSRVKRYNTSGEKIVVEVAVSGLSNISQTEDE